MRRVKVTRQLWQGIPCERHLQVLERAQFVAISIAKPTTVIGVVASECANPAAVAIVSGFDVDADLLMLTSLPCSPLSLVHALQCSPSLKFCLRDCGKSPPNKLTPDKGDISLSAVLLFSVL